MPTQIQSNFAGKPQPVQRATPEARQQAAQGSAPAERARGASHASTRADLSNCQYEDSDLDVID